MNEKQLNIYGEEIPISEIKKSEFRGKETFKEKFRRFHGYDKNHKCKDCMHFKQFHYNNKNYFKCEKLKITNSIATDIRKSDVACNLYKEDNNE